MSIFNKTTNIIGTKMPQWVINQLTTRSLKGSLQSRNNQNLQYLANKTAWVRLVSSININGDDMRYFNTKVPGGVSDPSDLAKKFVLFGGTSQYQNVNGKPSYQLRSGLNGSYGMLGTEEIQKYGYRPMPGITSVNIETLGRLGSVKQAVIEFKCWDKMQLDIMDALYFKLGYTMFLEWGHTFYYPSSTDLIDNMDQKKLVSTELYSIDPFQKDLTKEKVFRMISKTSRETDGNYDAMLGVVTNFNFSYNQEGGYDCTVKIMSLGFLADSIKINNPTTLPNLLKDEILRLKKTLEDVNIEDVPLQPEPGTKESPIFTIPQYINRINRIEEGKYDPKVGPGTDTSRQSFIGEFEPDTSKGEDTKIVLKYGIVNSLYPENTDLTNYDFLADDKTFTGPTLYVQKQGVRIPVQGNYNTSDFIKSVSLNKSLFSDIIYKAWGDDSKIRFNIQNKIGEPINTAYIDYSLPVALLPQDFLYRLDRVTSPSVPRRLRPSNPEKYESYAIPYIGANNRYYFIKITINLPLELYQNKIIGTDQNLVNLSSSQTLVKDLEIKKEYAVKQVLTSIISKTTQTNLDNINIQIGDNMSELGVDLKETKEAFKAVLSNSRKYEYFERGLGFINSTRKENYNEQKYEEGNTFTLTLSGNYNLDTVVSSTNKDVQTGQITKSDVEKSISIPYQILITDTALISSVVSDNNPALFAEYYKLASDENAKQQNSQEKANAEQQNLDQDVLSSQILDALSIQSALEIILRTIQVKSLNKSFTQSGKLDLEIGRKVYKYEMYNDEKFLNSIFSNGVYSGIWNQLLNPENISNADYANASDEKQFLINAKYGFATTLLGSNSLKDEEIFKGIEDKYVDHKQLLTSYVVPYQIDQDLIVGVKTNHPVYIPLGTLLMLLNHCCNLYDTKLDTIAEGGGTGILGGLGTAAAQAGKIVSTLSRGFQKPLIYIDYNPKLNFFLTNAKQLSTNPWVTLIPFEGTMSDYRQLFDESIIKGNNIDAIKELNGEQGQNNQPTALFNIGTEDRLSFWLPKIKDGESAYRGKVMNILINIDYLTGLIKNYSFQDSSNNIYLKPFLEQILSDVNKYLGNFNAFRVSYNDTANTLQIVDDQIIPPTANDTLIPYTIDPEITENRTELPVVGLNSIAKSLEIRTEIPARLGNLIAISANSDIKQQSQRSINADSIGFINVNYTDRYIPRRFSNSDLITSTKNGEIISSIQFNKSVEDFYSSINISYQDVSQMTSFYIEKMSKVKATESGSRASMMVPVSVNLSTDGIGGLSMGHSFTIPEQMLPYNYYSKKANTGIDGTVNQVGFAIVGLSHTIEGNVWNTSLKANMVAVKDLQAYKWTVAQLKESKKDFAVSNNYGLPYSGPTPNANTLRDSLKNLGYQEKGREISNAGDISAAMAQKASLLFAFIKQQVPGVSITVTGGHDQYHTYNNPGSSHNTGNSIDFTIYPNQQKDINAVVKVINEKASVIGIGFLNEYDKPSEFATAKHFHIYTT